jgi:ankyrin repeat protein
MNPTELDSLFDAIRGGDVERVESAIAADPSLLSQRNAQGISPLSWAAYLGQVSILESLRAKRGTPDFFEACIVGDEAAVRAAMARKQNLDAFAPDGFTPVALAAFFGQPGIARLLVDAGANVDLRARNGQGVGPIHAAMARGDLRTLELLLLKGADANARQEGGYTPLHEAASSGNLPAVAMLLMYGADPRAKADDGSTPLDLARKNGHALAERLGEIAREQ